MFSSSTASHRIITYTASLADQITEAVGGRYCVGATKKESDVFRSPEGGTHHIALHLVFSFLGQEIIYSNEK